MNENTSKKVLVFYSFRKHKTGYYHVLFDPLAERAGEFGMELRRGSLKDLHIYFEQGSMRIVESLTGLDLKDFDLVYFEQFHKSQQQALAAATYLERNNVAFFTPEAGRFTPISKLGQQTLLADQDLPLPDGLTTSAREFRRIFRQRPPFAYPLILKSIQDFGGNNNFLIRDYTELTTKLDQHKDVTFITQPFVPNDFDYRVLIFGGQIQLVLKRSRDAQETHLNNTNQDAHAELLDVSALSPAQIHDSLKAAKLVGRDNFCGLDLLINRETGEHVILEINEAPAIQTGAYTEEKMRAMLEYMKQCSSGGSDV